MHFQESTQHVTSVSLCFSVPPFHHFRSFWMQPCGYHFTSEVRSSSKVNAAYHSLLFETQLTRSFVILPIRMDGESWSRVSRPIYIFGFSNTLLPTAILPKLHLLRSIRKVYSSFEGNLITLTIAASNYHTRYMYKTLLLQHHQLA